MEIKEKVEFPDVGFYDIWEKMLTQAMGITSNELGEYVKESESNSNREKI